ncbi:response regulator [Caldimonas brevitalea]|uniref:Phosphate regulon transcriptional regulatory protein PhoB n=1 Tax=Caldimonas brevitalea TaxID=413882 RepID=A0A0G3BQT1_9BURK|nr:response regulator [Caldimonas brevitalea]AKJ30338.1 phosphate regulon transcriptional regulatory protein PhoB [Caldimonas brevitalea]
MKELVLVDDNPDQLELLSLALEVSPLARPVVTFGSGSDCVQALERGVVTPGLVVLDVNLPGLDGPDTVRRIRRIATAAGVPIVMLSTSDQAGDIQRSRDSGADGYVLKPHGDRSWADVIAELMRHWRDA